MEWELLITNLNDPEMFARVRENVERISLGSSPRSANTLKCGLERAFELKSLKRKR